MHKKYCDHLIDYFNGILDEETSKAYEAHLNTCEDCQIELAELEFLTEDLPYTATPMEPPSGMKERVLDNVFASEIEHIDKVNLTKNPKKQSIKLGKNWITPLLAATLLFSVFGNGYLLLDQKNTASKDPIALEGTDQVFKTVRLSPSETIQSTAVASMIKKDNKMEIVIQAEVLAPLKEQQAYQVWLLEDGKPYRAGTFIPNQDGTGAVSYPINYDGDHNWDTVAITLEPTSDSQEPQGEIILSSEL